MGRLEMIRRKGLGSSIHGGVGLDKPGQKAITESELCIIIHFIRFVEWLISAN
jgi:hypothetical protein